MQSTSKPYHDWGVVFAVEVNITPGADHPPGAASCHAEDCGVSFSWWHGEATTCQGWVSMLVRHSHPVHPHRQTAAGLEGSRRLPGSSRATWATTESQPATCPSHHLAPLPRSRSYKQQQQKRGIQHFNFCPALLVCRRGREPSHQQNS